jgi:hypothetical protein
VIDRAGHQDFDRDAAAQAFDHDVSHRAVEQEIGIRDPQ